MKSTIYSIFTILLLFTSCKSVKMDSPETATKLVEFSKSACYGDCPSYLMEVFTDGSVIYTGRRKVDRMGVHTSQLDKRAYTDLYKKLQSADLYSLDDAYNEDVSDGSVTRIMYYGKKGAKKIKTVYSFPGNLQGVVDDLAAIATKKSGWKAVKETEKKEDIMKEDQPTRKVFSYSQGACFGECPVFSLDVFSDMTMVMVGKRYSSKQGIYKRTMKENEYKELVGLVSGPAFAGLDEYYDKDIMDAQTFVMEYYNEDNRAKKVSTKITQGDVVKRIIDMTQEFEAAKGWEKQEGTGTEVPANNILISLSPKVEGKNWIKTKRHLGAKIVRFLSPNGTYFLMSVNEDLDIDRVMEELRRDRDVLAVEPGDRPAKPRGGNTRGGKANKHGKATIKKGGN